MNDINTVENLIVVDESINADNRSSFVYDISLEFERDARRYNRAFVEEQEVGIR